MKLKTQNPKLKTATKNVKLFFIILPFFSCLFTLFGCVSLKETTRGFMGVSTKVLEDNRPSAITKTFNYDYFTCYTKTTDILKKIKAYTYSKDIKKHMIAIYVSEEDTTPVGIFFKEIDAENTQVEIASPSTYAKELISSKLFSELELSKSLEEAETKYKK